MRIGVDLDGCVHDFTHGFIEWLVGFSGYDRDSLAYPDRWNTWECWDMSFEHWLLEFELGVQAGIIFRVGEPIEGAVDALTRLKDEGHSLHIVTHRDIHPRAIQSTWEWLAEHGVPYDTITFAKDKTTVPVDIFIDDNVDNYLALEAAGTTAVLMDQGWNRSLENARRVTSWAEFENEVTLVEVGRAISSSVTPRGNNVAEYVDPKTGGMKGVKPEQMSLVPVEALQALSRIYSMGAAKYERFNYLKGYPWGLSYDALQRHLMQWWGGDEVDDESNESHLMHAAWHCIALFMFRMYGLGTDDRWVSS